MKSIFKISFVLAFLMPGKGQSQITINDIDVFSFGANYKVNYDEMVGNVSPGNPGPNQQWDLSGLNQTSWDSIKVVPVASSPMGPALPGNRVLLRNNGNVDSEYYSISFDRLVSNGYVSLNGFETHSVPGEVRLKFPATYGQTHSGQYVWDNTFFVGLNLGTGFIVDSVRRKTTHVYDYVIDGWGTLITPSGTYQVLRQTKITQIYDTSDFYRGDLNIWIPNSEISYLEETRHIFWSNQHEYPLAMIRDIGNAGFIADGFWIDAPPVSTGINEEKDALDFAVFPNPADDRVHIRSAENRQATYRLFNSFGQLVMNGPVNNDDTLLDISGLKPGLYEIMILDGELKHSKKLIIQ